MLKNLSASPMMPAGLLVALTVIASGLFLAGFEYMAYTIASFGIPIVLIAMLAHVLFALFKK